MRKYDWSKEKVEKAAKEANCWFDCLEILGIPKEGYNYRTLQNKVNVYGIDVSHFNYNYAKTHNGKHYEKRNCNRSDQEIFSYGAKIKISSLKKEYISRVLHGEAKCEICGIKDWNGKPLVFQIHHVDGNHRNHVVDNLQLLCPNCHSQTENFSNKKRRE